MKKIISLSAVKIPTEDEIVEGLQQCGINPHLVNQDIKIATGKATFSLRGDKPFDVESFSVITENVDNVDEVFIIGRVKHTALAV